MQRTLKKLSLTLIWCYCCFLLGCARHYKGPTSDHFDGTQFFHNYGPAEKGFWDLLRWRFNGEAQDWPDSLAVQTQQQLDPAKNPDEIVASFLNHASVYIQHQGLKILTDPQWSERASPVSFAGPKRVRPPGVAIEDLPGVDIVLISHNHYDHLDLPTLQRLKELYNPTFYIPLGDGYLLESVGIERYKEVDWWDHHLIGADTTLHFVPVKHWSARGLFDRNKSLWGGFVVTSPSKKIFFAGDTGYCEVFKEIGKRFGGFDLSLIPIGAYEPRWFMQSSHMNPEEAVKAHLDLGSAESLGIHFGFWQLTDESIDAPLIALKSAKAKLGVSDKHFYTLDFGESRIVK